MRQGDYGRDLTKNALKNTGQAGRFGKILISIS